MQILDLSFEQSKDILGHHVDHAFAWTRDDVDPQKCLVRVSDEVREEILRMAELMNANPLLTELRSLEQFDIPNTLKLMEQIKERLNHPPGVAVIDSMPMDKSVY